MGLFLPPRFVQTRFLPQRPSIERIHTTSGMSLYIKHAHWQKPISLCVHDFIP